MTTTLRPFAIVHRGGLPEDFDYEAHQSRGLMYDKSLGLTVVLAENIETLTQTLADVEGIVSIEPSQPGWYVDDTEGGVRITDDGLLVYEDEEHPDVTPETPGAKLTLCPNCGQLEWWTDWEVHHEGECRVERTAAFRQSVGLGRREE